MRRIRVNQTNNPFENKNGFSEDLDGLSKKSFTNQKGQISVFLALGFLVLFTMFGMTVNVAMIVHDKINLQNATDFASIYVAQRQAELLNAIAHMNYQIRQANKLLAYRYLVLGTAGISGSQARKPFANNEANPDPYADKARFPFCISDRSILIYPGGNADEWCQSRWFSQSFPGIPILNVTNPFMGGNYGLRNQTVQIGQGLQQQAVMASAIDWWFTANFMTSYRLQISYRKALIKALARNLSKPIVEGANGMKDLYGKSVYDGAKKTFEFNLSESIRRTGGYEIQVRNSLEGVDIKDWLPEIAVYLVPVYSDRPPGFSNGAVSSIQSQFFYNMPQYYSDPRFKNQIDNQLLSVVDPNGTVRGISGIAVYPKGDDFEDIMGFEKNPWYMIYNQIQTRASSGALFTPLPNISLMAQAFSKPFGGHIGPWYGPDWPKGAPISSDTNKSEVLFPFRKVANNFSLGAFDPLLLPNSPKYPGDKLGSTSLLAQSATDILGDRGANRVNINDHLDITYNLFPGGTGQALAAATTSNSIIRTKELMAIAPDLFDIYNYSIEPNFHENYLLGKLDDWLMDEVVFSTNMQYDKKIWRDIGSSNVAPLDTFSVKDQLRTSRQTMAQQVFYYLDQTLDGLANILTSWVEGIEVADYRTPASGDVKTRFGHCKTFYQSSNSSGKPNVPGECLIDGGRTGYSVKMVSKEYLLSNQHQMSRNSSGSILNPPTN